MNTIFTKNIIRIVITVMLVLLLTGVAVGSVNPTLVGSYDTAGVAASVVVSGSYAYVADYDNSLVIVDISNAASPVFVGSYDQAKSAHDVAVSNSYAYVADHNNGIVIIDISNAASPVFVGSYNTAGSAIDVAVLGNYAYVADGKNGLVIIDISNTATPVLAGSYNTAGEAMGIEVSGSHAYIADGLNGLVIIDISNAASPVFVGSYDLAKPAHDVALSDSYAYVADTNDGLVIIDISNPTAPVLVGSYDAAGYARSVAVSGSYAYVADTNNGLVIIDISNAVSPVLVGSYDTAGSAYGVAVSGSYAYIADTNDGLVILNTGLSGTTRPATTPTINAEITSASFDSGYFASNEKINAHVTVKNNGDETHTFYVGYSVQDPTGKYYDAPYKSITLSSGQTDIVDIDWTVPWVGTKNQGSFKAITTLWEGETTSGLTGELDTYIKENAFTIKRYDYSWFENNADLRIQATDLMIMHLEPYNGTAGDYLKILNKDIRDQVLFPILSQFGEVFIPIPFDYELLNPDSVKKLNEDTVTKFTTKGVLSSSEIATVASYDLDALSMLSWYKDAIENIEISDERKDAGNRMLHSLDSRSEIDELNYYKQLLVQERDYWVVANNAETMENQENAVNNAINIVKQEKMMFRATANLPNSMKQHNFNEEIYGGYNGFYEISKNYDGQVHTTGELLDKYILKQQDYVDSFDSNDVNLVASSLSNEDFAEITQKQESTPDDTSYQPQYPEKTSVTTMLKDTVNKIVGWFESIF